MGDLAFDVTDGAGAPACARGACARLERNRVRGGLVVADALPPAEALARRFSEFGEVRSVRGVARHGGRGAAGR